MKCKICGKEEILPFKCSYCGEYFCSEHRLPEKHNCSMIWKAKTPKEKEYIPIIKKEGERFLEEENYYSVVKIPTYKYYRFSKKEVEHLAIGTLLVLLVGLSLFKEIIFSFFGIILITIIFTISFILHELAHKFIAQKNGLWAEFRLSISGTFLTLISIFLPFFKIISPGAVVIVGITSRKTTGKISMFGPLVNILLGNIFLLIFYIKTPYIILNKIMLYSALFNSMIALINLLPFGILDGYKVFLWNKAIWLIMFIASLSLFIICYMII
ncbi:MAG: AN1-type zinc finger domain-containing protein [Nitrososphaerota archaeon]